MDQVAGKPTVSIHSIVAVQLYTVQGRHLGFSFFNSFAFFSPPGAKVGADPTLTGAFVWLKWADQLKDDAGLDLVPLSSNPIDAVWTDRKLGKDGRTADDGLSIHDVEFAGTRAFNFFSSC